MGLVAGLLAAGSAVAVLALSGDDDQGKADSAAPTAPSSAGSASPTGSASWSVGSCVRMVSGPTDAQLSRIEDPTARRQLASVRRYEPIDCADSVAVAKITKLGGKAGRNGVVVDSGCAPDTDIMLGKTGGLADGSQIYCARNVKAPHPGDPGNGGGDFMAGDCAAVSSSDGVRVTNDRVLETPCGPKAYYAKVLAIAPTKAGCPAPQSLSRLAVPGRTGQVLCLGQGDRGAIARPGECVDLPSNKYYLPTRKSCTAPGTFFRLMALVDSPGQCPGGTRAQQHSGYDRFLCIRNSDGS